MTCSLSSDGQPTTLAQQFDAYVAASTPLQQFCVKLLVGWQDHKQLVTCRVQTLTRRSLAGSVPRASMTASLLGRLAMESSLRAKAIIVMTTIWLV